MVLIWKNGYFWPTFHIFSHQGKVTKSPSAHISLTYIHVFCSLFWLFLPHLFWKKIRIWQVWFLFGVIPGVDSYWRHFGTINGEQNLSWNVYYWYVFTLMPNLLGICKPRTLNDGRWRLSSIQKTQKAP